MEDDATFGDMYDAATLAALDSYESPDRGPSPISSRMVRWSRTSTVGALAAGFAFGLREVLEPPRDEQIVIEVDAAGETVGEPVGCAPDETALSDEMVCQIGCGQITARVAERDGDEFIANLHRGARHVLGSHPEDLRTVGALPLERLYRRTLVPALAGRVKGLPEHPEFFTHLLLVLDQMIGLGEDTRRFRSEEPAEFIEAEAAQIRKRAR